MVSINIKHMPTLWPRNPFLVIYAREGCTQECFSIFIHNCEKLEMTQVSTNRITYKQMLYIHTREFYTVLKKKKTTDRPNSIDKTQKHYAEQK